MRNASKFGVASIPNKMECNVGYANTKSPK